MELKIMEIKIMGTKKKGPAIIDKCIVTERIVDSLHV